MIRPSPRSWARAAAASGGATRSECLRPPRLAVSPIRPRPMLQVRHPARRDGDRVRLLRQARTRPCTRAPASRANVGPSPPSSGAYLTAAAVAPGARGRAAPRRARRLDGGRTSAVRHAGGAGTCRTPGLPFVRTSNRRSPDRVRSGGWRARARRGGGGRGARLRRAGGGPAPGRGAGPGAVAGAAAEGPGRRAALARGRGVVGLAGRAGPAGHRGARGRGLRAVRGCCAPGDRAAAVLPEVGAARLGGARAGRGGSRSARWAWTTGSARPGGSRPPPGPRGRSASTTCAWTPPAAAGRSSGSWTEGRS